MTAGPLATLAAPAAVHWFAAGATTTSTRSTPDEVATVLHDAVARSSR